MIQNIDYYPTILDIFGVANPVSYFHKIEALYPRSLLPLINENSFDNTRLLRIDNRFWGQTNKNKVYISGGNTYTATLHNQNYQWDVNPNAKIAKVDDEIESYLLERVSFDVREFLSSTLSAPAYILDLVKSELSQYLIHTLAAYHLKKFVHVSKLSLKNRQFMNIIIVQLEGASILNIIKYLTLSMFNNILVVDAVGREILPVIKTRLYRKISNVVFDLFSTTS